MVNPFKKSNYGYKCDNVKEEILKNLSDKFSSFETNIVKNFTTFDMSLEGMKKDIKDHEGREEISFATINKFIEKLEGMLFGNGATGLKTEVELLKSKGKSVDKDLQLMRIKISDNNKSIGDKVIKIQDNVKVVSDRSLVTSTKLYMFCGGISLVVTLLGIFVPMYIN